MKKLFVTIVTLVMLLGMCACKKKHKHNIVSYEAKEPTCTEVGHNVYEECTECDYTTYVKKDA